MIILPTDVIAAAQTAFDRWLNSWRSFHSQVAPKNADCGCQGSCSELQGQVDLPRWIRALTPQAMPVALPQSCLDAPLQFLGGKRAGVDSLIRFAGVAAGFVFQGVDSFRHHHPPLVQHCSMVLATPEVAHELQCSAPRNPRIPAMGDKFERGGDQRGKNINWPLRTVSARGRTVLPALLLRGQLILRENGAPRVPSLGRDGGIAHF